MEDFDKKPKVEAKKDESSTTAVSSPAGTSEEQQVSVDEAWSQDFIKHAAGQFEKNLQNLMQNGKNLQYWHIRHYLLYYF